MADSPTEAQKETERTEKLIERERKLALDRVLRSPAIQEVLKEAQLSRKDVREKAAADLADWWKASDVQRLLALRDLAEEPSRGPRALQRVLTGVSSSLVALLAATVAAMLVERPSRLPWAGLFVMAIGALAWALTHVGSEGAADDADTALESVRRELDARLVPKVRLAINELRRPPFNRQLRPVDDSGLADLFAAEYDVPTRGSHALSDALGRLRAGSLGIAGPRGAGKTTLVRAAVGGQLPWGTGKEPLGIMVGAPVRYEAREFVPYLFAQLCVGVLAPTAEATRLRRTLSRQTRVMAILTTVTAVSMVLVFPSITLHVFEASLPVVPILASVGLLLSAITVRRWWHLRSGNQPLSHVEREATEHLDRLRYLETLSHEVAGEIAVKPAKLSEKVGRSLSEQPLTLPELTDNYRAFVRRIASRRRPVVIGIDEVDKMASADEARRFLNDIKSLFGQENAYYLMSLSDDAMSAFEQRGLPLRDVFESVFDDVLRVEPLALDESTELLQRRVVYFAPPFDALCHAMSGGLPRELIRMAREACRIAKNEDDCELPVVAAKLVAERAQARHLAAEVVAAQHVAPDGTQPVLRWLRELDREPDAQQLLDRSRVAPVILNIRSTARDDAKDELELLVVELAAANYHAATVIRFFSDLDEPTYDAVTTLEDDGLSLLELLAQASRDLSIAPELAWKTTSDFRERVGLDPLDYPVNIDAPASA